MDSYRIHTKTLFHVYETVSICKKCVCVCMHIHVFVLRWFSDVYPPIKIIWSLLLLGLNYRSAVTGFTENNLPTQVKLEDHRSLPLPGVISNSPQQ